MPAVAVVLAYPWTDEEGVEHAPEEIVSIDPGKARSLVASGRARFRPRPAPPIPAPTQGVDTPTIKEARRGQH